MTEPIDNLAKFGDAFQTKCVVALLNDKPFVEQSLDILSPAFFESDANRWTVEKIIWYFGQYKALPTIEVIKKEADKLPEAQSVLKTAIIENLKNIFFVNKAQPSDLKYIKDELLQFCKNQALKNAVLKSVDLLAAGKFEAIKAEVDKAMNAGVERNSGHDWHDDIDARITHAARKVIPTPWDCINQIMDGGLGAGELGVIVAPSGIGKSWALSALGQHAMKLGYRVVHYTFELSDCYTGNRYDTITTGIAPQNLKHYPDQVREAVAKIPGRLVVKYYPTRMITALGIRAHIERMISLGYKPDLAIFDYPDLMRASSKSDARHEELGYIYEELRGMLGELQIPGWGASQSQRSSLQDDIVEADKIAGSYGKVMVADFGMSISRKVADKLTNTARAHAFKNRFGPDGLTFPMEMDLEHGRIGIYDDNSPQGMLLKQKLNSGEGMLKALMHKKFLDINSKNEKKDAKVYMVTGGE